MGLCALVITVAAYQMSSGARSDGSRPVRLYESMRRMSPYPLEPPYAPSSFVRSAPLQPHEVLERPHPSTCEALRRHLRSALPRRATAADGTARRAAILEICACGDSFTPRSSRAMDVRRIHLTEASLAQHASSLRGGRGDELAADFAQDVSGGDNNGFLLPFADCTFDAVVLSFCAPTLSRPFELLAEVNRVLAQDAPAIVALGGPLPKGRAGAMWDGMPDETQLYVIGSYFHYTGTLLRRRALVRSHRLAHAPPLWLTSRWALQARRVPRLTRAAAHVPRHARCRPRHALLCMRRRCSD